LIAVPLRSRKSLRIPPDRETRLTGFYKAKRCYPVGGKFSIRMENTCDGNPEALFANLSNGISPILDKGLKSTNNTVEN
jgi:hypothetical protein